MKNVTFLILAILLSQLSFSQTMTIHKNNATTVNFQLSQIDSITFSLQGSIPMGNLVAYYPFNGNANDESGNGNNGTVFGPTLTTDRFGNANRAYHFDGVNDSISTGNGINISNSAFTIAFWAKRDAMLNLYANVIGQGTHTTNQGLHLAFRDAVMQYRFTFGFYQNDLDVSPQYSDTLLHNWACSYDANSKARKVYRDGILIASDISSSNYVGSGRLYIGVGFPGDPSNFNGTIDDIRIYKRVLSMDEIQALYHEGGW